MDSELDEVLEDLYAAGEFDSTGSFRLSTEKALQKLGKFQLEKPAQYFCHLIAAGLVAGAEAVQVRLGASASTLWFRGAELPKDLLRDPYRHLLETPSNEASWAMRELAIALTSSKAGGVSRVEVSYPGVRQAEWEQGGHLKPLERGIQGLLVRLTHRYWPSRALQLLSGSSAPEMRIVKETMCFSGTPVSLEFGWKSWSAPSAEDELVEHRPKEPLAQKKIEGGEICYGVAGQLGRKSNSAMNLIVRGRRFACRIRLGKAQVWAWIKADHLPLDLSQTAPLKGADFLAVQQRVISAFTELQYELLASEERPLDDYSFREIVRQLARGLRSEGRLPECLNVVSRLPREGSRKAAVLGIMGQFGEAEEILRKEIADGEFPEGLKPSRILDLATVQARLGRREALDTWSRAFELVRSHYSGRKDHLVADSMERKLQWSFEFEELHKVWKEWEQALELMQHLGMSHRRTCSTLELGSYLSLLRKDYEKALELAAMAQQTRVAVMGAGNPLLGQSLVLRALAEWKLGSADAVETARRRYSMMETVYGKEHPETAASINLLSLVDPGWKERRSSGHRILEEKGLWQPQEEMILCFRGWFHSRSYWYQVVPLTWTISSS